MSGDEEDENALGDEATDDAPRGESSQRARLAVALGAALLLAGIIGVVILVGASSSDREGLPTGTCFEAWNEDPVAPIQDGQHAYSAHGYRQTLVTRLDRNSEVIPDPSDEDPPDDPSARCAVIFASPNADFEPGFGVRVYDSGRWFGLSVNDEASLEEIAQLQADAIPDSNAVLTASGKLGSGNE